MFRVCVWLCYFHFSGSALMRLKFHVMMYGPADVMIHSSVMFSPVLKCAAVNARLVILYFCMSVGLSCSLMGGLALLVMLFFQPSLASPCMTVDTSSR